MLQPSVSDAGGDERERERESKYFLPVSSAAQSESGGGGSDRSVGQTCLVMPLCKASCQKCVQNDERLIQIPDENSIERVFGRRRWIRSPAPASATRLRGTCELKRLLFRRTHSLADHSNQQIRSAFFPAIRSLFFLSLLLLNQRKGDQTHRLTTQKTTLPADTPAVTSFTLQQRLTFSAGADQTASARQVSRRTHVVQGMLVVKICRICGTRQAVRMTGDSSLSVGLT